MSMKKIDVATMSDEGDLLFLLFDDGSLEWMRLSDVSPRRKPPGNGTNTKEIRPGCPCSLCIRKG